MAVLRRPLRLAGLVGMAGLVYIAVNVGLVWRAAQLNQARPAQAIVVLGSAQYDGVPSPDLAARLSHALALWQHRLAPLLVVTGGKERADRTTEAGAAATWLAAHGVPAGAVVEVATGRNTWESLSATAAVLRDRGVRQVLLVSDPYHDDRISLMADALGLSAYVSPTRTSPIQGGALIPYYAKEVAEVCVGRVIGMRTLGHLEVVLGI